MTVIAGHSFEFKKRRPTFVGTNDESSGDFADSIAVFAASKRIGLKFHIRLWGVLVGGDAAKDHHGNRPQQNDAHAIELQSRHTPDRDAEISDREDCENGRLGWTSTAAIANSAFIRRWSIRTLPARPRVDS
jgi:hypothetical protein